MADEGDIDLYRKVVQSIDPAIYGAIDFKYILNAALRTRYKYAEYVIWRPCIYDVLHTPFAVNEQDYENCYRALKVSQSPKHLYYSWAVFP